MRRKQHGDRGTEGDSRASWDDYYQFTGVLENQFTKMSQRSQQKHPTPPAHGSTLCLRGHHNALSKDKVDKRKLQFSSFEQP